MNKGWVAALVVMVTQGMVACDRSATVVSPSSPLATQQESSGMILGFVLDTAFRPLGAATVTILDGALTGTSTTTGADGQFSLQGPFDRATRFRADKEGHVSATQTWSCSVDRVQGRAMRLPGLGST